MKRFLFLLLIFPLISASCSKDDDVPTPEDTTEQTILMYLPWGSNLLDYFQTNIEDMEKAMAQNPPQNTRVLVYLNTTPTQASLFELKYENGENTRTAIKSYSNHPFTTAAGITSLLNDMKSAAPGERYAMIIGCHGMAWIPAGTPSRSFVKGEKEYWEYDGEMQTRWFGGFTSEYQTDISTLAQGISNAGITMEYILFDDCYMSSIEVAYELKDVTGHIIACPTEILIYGMPYEKIGRYLYGNVNYEKITDEFLDFYENYPYPYGTIGVTVCSELENMAAVMKEINTNFTLDPNLLGSIQRMDQYTPIRFFDFGDYVTKLCTSSTMLAEFEAQLERTIPSKYRKHTEYYPTSSIGAVKIDAYSGITVSDPSTSSATSAKTETAWYKATH